MDESDGADDGIVHARGPRPTAPELARELVDVAVSLPLFATAPLLRRWHHRWGASDEEVEAAMPGDELVADCQYHCTRAITIDAPPEAVWPWLAQTGFGKGGFYSNDLLDNAAHPSAQQVLDDLQDVEVGDLVPMFTKVSDSTAFRIVGFAEADYLVWLKPDSSWAWQLRRLGGGRTRLITRLKIRYRWDQPADAVLSLLLNEFGDFPMMRKMLRNIKQRAERIAADGS